MFFCKLLIFSQVEMSNCKINLKTPKSPGTSKQQRWASEKVQQKLLKEYCRNFAHSQTSDLLPSSFPPVTSSGCHFWISQMGYEPPSLRWAPWSDSTSLRVCVPSFSPVYFIPHLNKTHFCAQLPGCWIEWEMSPYCLWDFIPMGNHLLRWTGKFTYRR